MERDFTTISPSALSIILMKGHTTIPFARQAAELVSLPNEFVPNFSNSDFLFWAKVLHFETRYAGITQLLSGIDINNILELSSGFNFRCLQMTREYGKYYIDTDLPEMISKKKEMLKVLANKEELNSIKMLPLNVLDNDQFSNTVSQFSEGPIIIINEGLLIYFDMEEKKKLCKIIYEVLKQRGGYWITSDIYIRAPASKIGPRQDKNTKEFTDKHNIENNKFSSFEEARIFFEDNGFTIDKEENIDISELSSYKYLAKIIGPSQIGDNKVSLKLQTSWRLKI